MLQGSLDNFALDEVLNLLSTTLKTGKLDLKGGRGTGTLRLQDGRLVDAVVTNGANGSEPEDVVFELLRYDEGTFNFSASDREEGSYSEEVPEVLRSAESRLADWKTIEAVVPSLRHQVAPVPKLPEEDVTITRDEWSVLVTVADGCPVSNVCDELDLGEVEGSRRLKGLAERGLITVGPPRTGSSFRRAGIDARRAQTMADETEDDGEIADQEIPDRRQPPAPLAASVIRTEETGATAGGDKSTESEKSGGLLMRYLKSDD